jgi:plasmid stabilization system protein ParE
MKYEIELTAKVKTQLEDLLGYLEANFGRKAAVKLYTSFTSAILSLERFPLLGTAVDGQGTRKCVLRRKSILFYEVEGNVVRVLAIRDGRQDWKP